MNRDLLLLSISMAVWGVGEGMFFNFQSLNLERLGADPLTIGGILGLAGAAMTAAHLPAGYLADRFGRRPILLLAWWMATIATAVMALSRTLDTFVIGMVIYALTAFSAGPLNAYAVSARGQMPTEQVVTIISAVFNGGAILGPSIGGWIGKTWGLNAVFYMAFFIFVISTAVVWLIKPQPVEVRTHRHSHWQDLVNPKFLGFISFIFATSFVMFVSQPLAANFLQNERQMPLNQIGLMISGRSVGIVFLSLFFGRRPAGQGLLFGLAAMAAYNVLMWQGQSFLSTLIAYTLMGAYVTARNMASVIGYRMVRPENIGLALGAMETVLGLVAISAPPLAGFLYTQNPALMFPVGLVGVLIMLPAGFLFIRKQENTV